MRLKASLFLPIVFAIIFVTHTESAHALAAKHLFVLPMLQAGAPVFSTTPATVDFGPVAVGVATPVFATPPPFSVPLQINNTGTAALTSTISFSSTEFAFDSATNLANPVTVAAASSVTGGLVFKPSAVGARAGQLISTDNAAGSPHVVALSGTGISVPNNDFGVFLDPSLPSTINVTAGQSASFNMWVLAGPGLNASSSVVGSATCMGGPAGSTCNISPQTFSSGFNQTSTRQKITVSITVPAGAAMLRHGFPIIWGMAVLPVMWLGYRRRKIVPYMATVALLTLAFGITSCGGGSGSGGGGIPLSVTVNAIGLGTTHTTTVPINVQ